MAALLFTNFDRINSIFTQRGQVIHYSLTLLKCENSFIVINILISQNNENVDFNSPSKKFQLI